MFEMGIFRLVLTILTLVEIVSAGPISSFDMFYRIQWGGDHAIVSDGGDSIELVLDEHSGAGFESLTTYVAGLFGMKIKLPQNKSIGFITSFFLSGDRNIKTGHDEFDFEFYCKDDEFYLNTNIFVNDLGQREQSIHLWFDPSADFHEYSFLWNPDMIVFFVGEIPIRIFKNHKAEGVNFPSGTMKPEASIWNVSWAGNVDWTKGPFKAQYAEFFILGCPTDGPVVDCPVQFKTNLTPKQLQDYEDYRKKYMFYDYCSDKPKTECQLPSY